MGVLKSNIDILSKEEMDKIHLASLEILGDVGMRVEHKRLLKLMDGMGAKVDYSSQVVKFPSKLVESEIDMEVEKTRKKSSEQKETARFSLTAGAFNKYIFDMEEHNIRIPRRKDFKEMAILCDALENVRRCVFTFSQAEDIPNMSGNVHSWAIGFKNLNTEKVTGYFLSKEVIKYIWDMWVVVRGSEDEARHNPFCTYSCFISDPLMVSRQALEIAFVLYDLGVPVQIHNPMPIPGMSSPVTGAGSLALGNAQVLGGILLTRALKQHAGFHGAGHTIVDQSSNAACYSDPVGLVLNLAGQQMGEYYGFNNVKGLMGTADCISIGIQAGIERAHSRMLSVLAGGGVGMGGFLSPDVISLPVLVVDSEMAMMMERLIEGVKVDEERIALELIKNVGIGGNFMSNSSALEHTVKHFREEMWLSKILERKRPEVWQKDKTDAYENAKERVKEILATHHPQPLSSDQEKEIDRIVKKADQELKG